MALTREQIAAGPGRPAETVQVDEWGGEVLVERIPGGAMLELMPVFGDESATEQDRIFALLARALVDDDRQRLFDGPDDLILRGASLNALNTLSVVALRLNGLSGKQGN